MNFKLVGLGVAVVAATCGLVYAAARAGAKAGVASQIDAIKEAAREGAEDGVTVNVTIKGCDENEVSTNVITKE